MTAPPHLTARIFAGYLQCNTKGQLLSRSMIAEPLDLSDIVREKFKAASAPLIEKSMSRRIIRYDELALHITVHDGQPCLIDCDTAYVDTNKVIIPQRLRKNAKTTSDSYLPILFLPHAPIQTWHKTLLCFSAIALGDVARAIPSIGYICYGQDRNIKKVRFSDAIESTVEILQEAKRNLESQWMCR